MTVIKGILFDLDGTVLHSAPDFHSVINQMLSARSLPAIDYKSLEHQVSNGARAMIAHAFSIFEGELHFDTLRDEFLERYFSHSTIDSQLYPGISQLLNHLDNSGISWGIVTNKPAKYSDKIMRHFALTERAAAIVCPDHVSKTKPDAEPLLLACHQMGLKPEQCLYLGDHLRDIQAGKNASMDTIACSYGYLNVGEDPQSWKATYQVERSEDIAPLLIRLGVMPSL